MNSDRLELDTSGTPAQAPRKKKKTRRRESVRQWILLLPLATAAAGSATMQLADQYEEYLPALFFIGALVITVAMQYQRNLLRQNLKLAERVQEAHERLDILHRLEVELNQTLDVAQATRTVLDHAMNAMDADAAALWLSPQFEFPLKFSAGRGSQAVSAESDETRDTLPEIVQGTNWHLVHSRGWKEPAQRKLLQDWHTAHNAAICANSSHIVGVPDAGPDCPELARMVPEGSAALVAPIRCKNEDIGSIMLFSKKGAFEEDDVVLLDSIALVVGPSLENALLYQTAAARADIDGLTGLYNHRAIQERLNQEVARAQRAFDKGLHLPFAIVMMDLTDFKIFNDTYGHAIGDEVLRTVSDCLRHNFRLSDTVSRYGGDEFLALLPETDGKGALVLCERLIKALEEHPFHTAETSGILIRMACGIASFPEDGRGIDDLFEIADSRVYQAKHRGISLVKDPTAAPVGAAKPEPTTTFSSGSESEHIAALWKSFGVLDTLISAIDNRDRYTRRHSEQVMHYALLIAREMELPPDLFDAVQTCGLLHDVGKVAVPDAILRKPGRLNAEEMRLMQQHAEFGSMIVRNVPHLDRVLEGVRSHHESYDGTGYPDALQGEEIPLMGRLLAVPVCFSAMTTDRPYRKALSFEDALREIERGRGKQFDPVIVDAFLRAARSDPGKLEAGFHSEDLNGSIDAATPSESTGSRSTTR